jgi:hypothetical protein
LSQARTETGLKAKLHPDADNWAALQGLLDVSTHLTLPAGTWPIHQTLNIGNTAKTIQGQGVERTTLWLTADFAGPTIGIGGAGRWPGSESYGAADGCNLFGLTARTSASASANCKCVFLNGGDDFLMDKVRVRGSAYEGIVTGSDIHRVTLRNIEAWDCGNGGPAYTLSTAGINATSIDLLIEDFRTLRCGQGVETGNTRVTVRRGVVSNPGSGLPSLGINIGSSVYGVWRTSVEDCTIDGYDTALSCGSGNGRIAGVYFRRNTIHDLGAGESPITFFGGTLNNTVPHPDQGPTTEGSEITDNTIYIHTPHQGTIGYNGGPVDVGGVNAREPLTITGNEIYFDLADPSLQTAPVIYFAGKILGDCIVRNNRIFGLPEAPSRGDIASFTNNDNPAVQGFPNLSTYGNYTFKPDSRERSPYVRIEGL